MDILVLGGTQWIGRAAARTALAAGHRVTCLARGSAAPPSGVELVRADRTAPGAYDALAGREFDAVLDVARQPGQVRSALAALAGRAGHWTFVSTGNVYADTATRGADETAELVEPAAGDEVDAEQYGAGKVACERAVLAAAGDRALVARLGLVTGPGDHTGRTGYYVARAARDPRAPMLVPALGAFPTSVVDVRDVTAWWLAAAARGLVGTFDVVGPTVAFDAWIALCREVGGHRGPLVEVSEPELLAAGVSPWSGPVSLPQWVGEPGWEGFVDRSGAAAAQVGLLHRDRRELLVDLLAWEREQGLDRERGAGLRPAAEQELVARFGA